MNVKFALSRIEWYIGLVFVILSVCVHICVLPFVGVLSCVCFTLLLNFYFCCVSFYLVLPCVHTTFVVNCYPFAFTL